MVNFKKCLALFLAFASIVSLSAGCGKGTKQTDSSSVNVGTETSDFSSQNDAEESGATNSSEESMNGTSQKSGVANATTTSATKKGSGPSEAFVKSLKGTKVTIFTSMTEKKQRGTASGDRYYSILNKVGQKYGATIQTTNIATDALLTSITSGQPLANVISADNISNWLNAGAAANLTDAMKASGVTFKEDWYNQDIRKFMNFNNGQYGWISDIAAPFFIFYNKRLVSSAKLADPYTLYKQGTWTFDKLRQYSMAMTKKAADGSYITFGMSAYNMTQALTLLVYQNGGDLVSFKNNKLTNALETNNTLNALKFFQTLCNDGYITSGGDSWSARAVDFTKGKVGMLLSTKYIASVINDNNMSDAVGMVPVPYGPDSKNNTKIYYNQAFVTMIPKPCQKDAAKILFLINEVNKEVYANREKDFKDDFRTIIRDEASYELFKTYSINTNKATFKYDDIATIDTPLNSLSVSLTRDAKTPAQAVSGLKTTFENTLNTNWGNVKFTGK